MGQLEKYGLYVLCLVIFLILGVAIWGGGDMPPHGRGGVSAPQNAALHGGARDNEESRGGDSVVHAGTGTVAALLGLGAEPGKVAASNDPPATNGGTPGEDKRPSPVVETPPVKPPAPGARPTHKIENGEYLETVARRLGSVALVAELRRLNPKVDPKRMPVGTVLELPTADEVKALLGRSTAASPPADRSADSPAAATGGTRSYVIAKGDTLSGIAQRQLGTIRRLDEIYKLNPGVDSTSLAVGRKLVLPAK